MNYLQHHERKVQTEMEDTKTKRRTEIRFFSQKNGKLMIVYSNRLKHYAEQLEQRSDVAGYECCIPLDVSKYVHVDKTGIRKQIFEMSWMSDFKIELVNGRKCIRELVPEENILKKMMIIRLEFSRRYWEQENIRDWKIVLT